MKCSKKVAFIILFACSFITVVSLYLMSGIEQSQIQSWLENSGAWAPVFYVTSYTLLTLFVLPSTPLNLAGGFIFGPWLGTFWTTMGALIAAVLSFAFARTVGREIVAKRLAGYWQSVDNEIKGGGLPYIFAIRLLPIVPYGLFNFAAGLTSVSFKDYMMGTLLGTAPGLFPFVMLGSSSAAAFKAGNLFSLTCALILISLLVIAATWYQRHRGSAQKINH
ncbi:TVP38/TMEM64 family protein [Sphaerothrix gracilis]|uniref:TVP38/TMEM64 family protein n=1 Tax=Sphaerothrix gracilis TaxID=3151835 RepID=UPI0031FCAEB3